MPRLASAGAREAARTLLAASGDTLTEREAKRALAAYGVPVVEEKLARTADEALAAARSLGYPVALKVESPAIPHKTQAGVVRLSITDDAALRKAYDEAMAAGLRAARADEIYSTISEAVADCARHEFLHEEHVDGLKKDANQQRSAFKVVPGA